MFEKKYSVERAGALMGLTALQVARGVDLDTAATRARDVLDTWIAGHRTQTAPYDEWLEVMRSVS